MSHALGNLYFCISYPKYQKPVSGVQTSVASNAKVKLRAEKQARKLGREGERTRLALFRAYSPSVSTRNILHRAPALPTI